MGTCQICQNAQASPIIPERTILNTPCEKPDLSCRPVSVLTLAVAILAFLSCANAWCAPGTVDTFFGTEGFASASIGASDKAQGVAVYQSGPHAGKIVVVGWTGSVPAVDFAVMRFNANGSLDTTFSGDGIATVDFMASNDYAYGVAIQSDGKIVVVGDAENPVAFLTQLGVVRLNADGTLDTSFGTGGKVTSCVNFGGNYWRNVALDHDGNILVCGQTMVTDYNATIVRINTNGTIIGNYHADFVVGSSPSPNELFKAIAVQPDGAIVAVGQAHDGTTFRCAVARFTSSGVLDTSFHTNGQLMFSGGTSNDNLTSVTLDASGNIYVAGFAQNAVSQNKMLLAKITPAGSLDSGFMSGGKALIDITGSQSSASGVDVAPDGEITLAGSGYMVSLGYSSFAAARLLSDGSMDTGFGTGGVALAGASPGCLASAAALTADGKMVIVGVPNSPGSEDFLALRLNMVSTDMTLFSCTNTQNTNGLAPGQTGDIIRLTVWMTGDLNAQSVSSFQFSTAGSTNASDIASAALYYTGNSNAFGMSTQVGDSVDWPSGPFTISGIQPLSEGKNYFWLAYTLNPGATLNHVVDAQCPSFTLSREGAKVPSPVSPSGSRLVSNVIAHYNVAASNPGAGTTTLPPQTTAQSVSASDVTLGSGVTVNTDPYYGTGNWGAHQWTTATSRDLNDYMQIVITPGSGKKVVYQTLDFALARDWDTYGYIGPQTVEVRYSTDGFASSNMLLQTIDMSSWGNMQQHIISLNISGLGEQSGPITFRWYAYNRPTGASAYSVLCFAHSSYSLFSGTGSDLFVKGYVTEAPPDAPPSSPGASAAAADRITWTWADNSSNEAGFKVWADSGTAAPTTLRKITAAGITAWQQTGLNPNTQYSFQVAATNYGGDSSKTANYTTWTLAAVPVAPIITSPTDTTLNVAIGTEDGNPSGTAYAIHCTTTDKWIQADGSQADTPAWLTATGWGETTITGLTRLTSYSFEVMARNGLGTETARSPAAGVATLPVEISFIDCE